METTDLTTTLMRTWRQTLQTGTTQRHNTKDHPNYYASNPATLITTSSITSLSLGTGDSIYSNLAPTLESASHELILVTCFWARSRTLETLNRVLLSLSKKGNQTGTKIRVRICFSSCSLWQKLFHTFSRNGQLYPPEVWVSRLGLPDPELLVGLDLQVKSVFFLPFSVMHPKFIVLDRKQVFLPSCNVSWEDWFEGCVGLTGEVVEQFVVFWTKFWANREDQGVRFPYNEAAETGGLDGEWRGSNDGDDDEIRYNEHNDDGGEGDERNPFHEDRPTWQKKPVSPCLPARISSTNPTNSNRYKEPNDHNNDNERDEHNPFREDRSTKQKKPTSPRLPLRLSSTNLTNIKTLFLPSPHHINPHFNIPFLSSLPFLPFLSPSPVPPTPLNTFLLSAIASAKTSIYIQTPNLTSAPVLAAILDALLRPQGVDVRIVTSERLMVLEQLVTAGTTTARCVKALIREYERRRVEGLKMTERSGGLSELEAQSITTQHSRVGRLRIEFYEPLPSGAQSWRLESRQMREPLQSHLKLTVIDNEIVVLGSGNLDRASWYTSQELGIAFSSKEFAGVMMGVLGGGGVLEGRKRCVYDSQVNRE